LPALSFFHQGFSGGPSYEADPSVQEFSGGHFVSLMSLSSFMAVFIGGRPDHDGGLFNKGFGFYPSSRDVSRQAPPFSPAYYPCPTD